VSDIVSIEPLVLKKVCMFYRNLLESAERLFQNKIRDFFFIKMEHKIKIRNIGRWSLLAPSYLRNNKGYNKLVCVKEFPSLT
jgi:hypothetical protein